MNSNLTEHTSEVVGWDSTCNAWDADKQVLVRDSSTETNENKMENFADKNISTDNKQSVGVQTTNVKFMSNSNEETDQKLAAWLRKIMPALEKELNEGTAQVHDSQSSSHTKSFAKVSEYQEIDVKSHFSESIRADNLIVGNFLWLSVILQNNPALIVTCSVKMEDSSSSSFLLLFEPQRNNKKDGNVYWKEQLAVPIKEKLEHLVVNTENRDLFAGASSNGDLFIWEYARSGENESKIVEIFSKTGDDSVNGITFCANNTLICCFADGNILSYKITGKQSCAVDKLMKIADKIVKSPPVITAITNIDKTEDFIIGLLSGKIFHCSTNQDTSHDGSSINPIVRELNSHKFAVKSLKHVQHSNQNMIISFDASSEIFVHGIDDESHDKTLKYVIRLPLPIKNSIAFTSSMEHIFCPLPNGNLEIFNVRSQTRRIIEGRQSGSKALAQLSKNESWLITGIFDNGLFKIYNINLDD